MPRWALSRQATLVIAGAALLLLLVSIGARWQLSTAWEAGDQVVRTQNVLAATHQLLGHLIDAETGQRGFLLTGNEEYLEPYLQGSAAVEKDLEHLRTVVGEDPEQAKRLQSLTVLSTVKLDELQRTIAVRRVDGFEAANALVATDLGKLTMNRIRTLLDEMESRERDLLATRLADNAMQRRRFSNVLFIGALGALALLLAGVLALNRAAAERLAATRHLRESEERLRTTPAQHRRRGDRDRPARAGDLSQRRGPAAHGLVRERRDRAAARRGVPHRQRGDACDGGEPGRESAARGGDRRPRQPHRADRARRPGVADRRQRRADSRCRQRDHGRGAGLPRRQRSQGDGGRTGGTDARGAAGDRRARRARRRGGRQSGEGSVPRRALARAPLAAQCDRRLAGDAAARPRRRAAARARWIRSSATCTCRPSSINDLLDVSRIVSGKLSLEQGPIDMAAVDADGRGQRPSDRRGARDRAGVAGRRAGRRGPRRRPSPPAGGHATCSPMP